MQTVIVPFILKHRVLQALHRSTRAARDNVRHRRMNHSHQNCT